MERAIGAGDRLAELRRKVAAIEGRIDPAARLPAQAHGTTGTPEAADQSVEPSAPPTGGVGFGIAAIDRRLGLAHGLAFGALHEVLTAESRDAGALIGFAAALVARRLAVGDGRVVWIDTGSGRRDGGDPYGPGLHGLGLDPGRIVRVAVERPEEALWAFEEALSCRGTAAVIGEIPGTPRVLDLTATRRLALRAAREEGDRGTLALLLRPGGGAQATAAATRWRVSPRRSRPFDGFGAGLGRPAFRLELDRNRDGRLGTFDIEWDPHDRRFAALPANPGARAAPVGDRPAAAAGGGRILVFGPAGGR